MSTREELTVYIKRNGNRVDETMTMDQLHEKAETIRKRRRETSERSRLKKKQRIDELENDNMILKTHNLLLQDLLEKKEDFPSSEIFNEFLASFFP